MRYRFWTIVVGIVTASAARGQNASGSDSSRLVRVSDPRVWGFTGEYATAPVVFQVTGIHDKAACYAATVTFLNMKSPKASGDVSQTQVTPSWTKGSPTDASCVARYDWQFGPTPGDQRLVVQLYNGPAAFRPVMTNPVTAGLKDTAGQGSKGNGPALVDQVETKGLAHSASGLVVGLAFFGKKGITGVHGADTALSHRQFRPMVGGDLPLRQFVGATGTPAWIDNLRLVIGTLYSDPGFNFIYGLEIAPLFDGPSALTAPVQVSVGYMAGIRSHGSGYVGVHISGTSVLSTVLTGLGITSGSAKGG